ncbi:HEPN domain-containing protein [Candidatus Parcubacteria bacterium]|nr:MAG: HEPN domain-containing protein [Candidatus Parcubacteria bacterium]
MNRYADWLAQAERDLERAAIDIQYEYWEWACFTAQQAAEKAVKALLMKHGFSVWGHSITPMLRRLSDVAVPSELIRQAQLLDTFYIPTRYPNGFAEGKPADYYNEQNAQEAVNAARNIIRFCKDNLS